MQHSRKSSCRLIALSLLALVIGRQCDKTLVSCAQGWTVKSWNSENGRRVEISQSQSLPRSKEQARGIGMLRILFQPFFDQLRG
eukprot:s1195_g6.t1